MKPDNLNSCKVGLIPLRAGSKGLVNKNIRNISGFHFTCTQCKSSFANFGQGRDLYRHPKHNK